MQSSDFLTKLNKNYQSGPSYKSFSTVTVTEQGQNIDGKYSFPGNDTALQGLNYPFPTVLTQTDIFGSTVNLHYGRWPRIGLLWEENSRKLDLLADIKTKAEDSTLNDKRKRQGAFADTFAYRQQRRRYERKAGNQAVRRKQKRAHKR